MQWKLIEAGYKNDYAVVHVECDSERILTDVLHTEAMAHIAQHCTDDDEAIEVQTSIEGREVKRTGAEWKEMNRRFYEKNV